LEVSYHDQKRIWTNARALYNRTGDWRSASEMTYIVSSGALNSTHSLTHLEWRRLANRMSSVGEEVSQPIDDTLRNFEGNKFLE